MFLSLNSDEEEELFEYAETYDLLNEEEDLKYHLKSLQVDEILKVQVPKNSSVGWFYNLEMNTIYGNLLEISGPTDVPQETNTMLLGAPGIDEYTLKVIGAGKGKIQFVPLWNRTADYEPFDGMPTYTFSFASHE